MYLSVVIDPLKIFKSAVFSSMVFVLQIDCPIMFFVGCELESFFPCVELVIRKNLGLPASFKKGSRSDYIKSQIVDYDEQN